MSENMSPNDKKKQAAEGKVEASVAAKDEEPKMAKRPAEDLVSSAKRLKETEEALDLATNPLGLVAGDRLEVEWDLVNGDETKHHWWGATLLEHDGRTTDSVAIRTLEYDPHPEGGFPERSKEDVIFIQSDTLLNPETHDELHFRIISSDNSAVMFVDGREGLEELVNTVLVSAMEKASKNWAALPRAQQALMAEKVAEKKEKLIELMHSHQAQNKECVMTAEVVKMLLQKTMAEE